MRDRKGRRSGRACPMRARSPRRRVRTCQMRGRKGRRDGAKARTRERGNRRRVATSRRRGGDERTPGLTSLTSFPVSHARPANSRSRARALAPAPENTKAPPVSGKGLSPRFTRSGYLATGSFSSFQAVIPPRIDATFVNPIAASSNAALPERPPERHTRTMGVSRDQSRAT